MHFRMDLQFDLPGAKGEIRAEWGLYSDYPLKRILDENKVATPISEKNKYIGTKVQYVASVLSAKGLAAATLGLIYFL